MYLKFIISRIPHFTHFLKRKAIYIFLYNKKSMRYLQETGEIREERRLREQREAREN